MLSRRAFMGHTMAGASFISLSGSMPGLFAAAAAEVADRTQRVLVVIELAGGNDGLNTVIPFEDDLYYKNRPTLGVPKEQVLRINELMGFHPAMGPAFELFQAGKLAVVQGVGYPDPDRSHFRSMEIWHTASTSKKVPLTGWLGRVVDEGVSTAASGDLLALAFTGTLPAALQAEKFAVPVIQQIEAFATVPDPATAKQKILKKLSTVPTGKGKPVDFLRAQAETAFQMADRLRTAADRYKSDVMYPGELGSQLRRAAQVITADLGVRLLYVSQGGYDTHSNQLAVHPGLLGEFSGALAAFQTDLEKHGVANNVMVMAFSEFGRRVDENASRGTDHGAASSMFLVGSKVRGGLAGSYPSLEKLGDGDLIHTVDFRSVYATVLQSWLGCPAEKLLGQKFTTLPLIAT